MNTKTPFEEAADLLDRWKHGDDVQDALAHKLRHFTASLIALHKEAGVLREDRARLDWLLDGHVVEKKIGAEKRYSTLTYIINRADIDVARAVLPVVGGAEK